MLDASKSNRCAKKTPTCRRKIPGPTAESLSCPPIRSLSCTRPQSLYLSRMKNQRGHWVCWMSTSRKNGLIRRTHNTLLHVISRTLKRLGIPHQVKSSEPFTAGKNLRMDIVVSRGGLRDAPNREYREKSILLDVTHADPQAQVHLRRGSADHDGSAASTSEACKRQHYARP